VLDALREELAGLLAAVTGAGDRDLADLERVVRDGVLAVGGRLLEAGLAARGTGKTGPRLGCPCGSAAGFEGYRPNFYLDSPAAFARGNYMRILQSWREHAPAGTVRWENEHGTGS